MATDPEELLIEKLENRFYKTYKARLELSKRIQRQATAWNAWITTSSVSIAIASIAMIRDPKIYGGQGDVLMAVLSLVTLVGSLVVSGCRFGERSRDAFHTYTAIQRLSAEMERVAGWGDGANAEAVERIQDQYNQLIESSENHSEADYFRALKSDGQLLKKSQRQKIRRATVGESLPYLSLLATCAALLPVMRWFF